MEANSGDSERVAILCPSHGGSKRFQVSRGIDVNRREISFGPSHAATQKAEPAKRAGWTHPCQSPDGGAAGVSTPRELSAQASKRRAKEDATEPESDSGYSRVCSALRPGPR